MLFLKFEQMNQIGFFLVLVVHPIAQALCVCVCARVHQLFQRKHRNAAFNNSTQLWDGICLSWFGASTPACVCECSRAKKRDLTAVSVWNAKNERWLSRFPRNLDGARTRFICLQHALSPLSIPLTVLNSHLSFHRSHIDHFTSAQRDRIDG